MNEILNPKPNHIMISEPQKSTHNTLWYVSTFFQYSQFPEFFTWKISFIAGWVKLRIQQHIPESSIQHLTCSERISSCDLLRRTEPLLDRSKLLLRLISHCASVSNRWLRSIALRSAAQRSLRLTMNLNCSGDPSYSCYVYYNDYDLLG